MSKNLRDNFSREEWKKKIAFSVLFFTYKRLKVDENIVEVRLEKYIM